MGLQWVRLDSNIASHDKILPLLDEKNGKDAAWMYVCSLGYCGHNATDGFIPFGAMPFIHGRRVWGDLLVKYGLWAPDPKGWRIPNWIERQELTMTTEAKRAQKAIAAQKANCIRWHGSDCGCWQDAA